DQATQFAGTITARGGPNGGDGGWVETSSQGQLVVDPSASVSAAAPGGTPGVWLLDPGNLTVGGGAHDNITITPISGSESAVTPTGNGAFVSVNVVSDSLNAGTNVTLTTVGAPGTETGNITVNALNFSSSPPLAVPVSWSTATRLTLNAAG